ncbi:hypothetical protein EV13_2545 [Prochlorococcus sp. MIT 0702]|nr:hypothetical protein EV12_2334 [Prochlorococcus sp. MIT 0701]KGG26411.1 hypothetical protein EV13_2545 [Prochlorococcus sp. MIT 0702]KGG31167.1 hypothetical protein EV14_2538 [Prochlorococcus sp. MIT 0703]
MVSKTGQPFVLDVLIICLELREKVARCFEAIHSGLQYFMMMLSLLV